MGQCQHLFVATNSQSMVYIFSSFLRFFLIFQSTRDIGIMKGDYKSNFFDENKRLEKAYYSNTLQRSQKCFRFSASVHFNQLFLRTNRNQIQHIRQPKTVQKNIANEDMRLPVLSTEKPPSMPSLKHTKEGSTLNTRNCLVLLVLLMIIAEILNTTESEEGWLRLGMQM